MDLAHAATKRRLPAVRWLRPPPRTLAMRPQHLREMLDLAWTHWPLEVGGVILGRPFTQGHKVTHVIGPGPNAAHHTHGFVPDHEWQTRAIAAAWAHDPDQEYLGDWHTHPGGTTRPSRLDKATLASIAAYPDARQPTPYMLIISLSKDGHTDFGARQHHPGGGDQAVAVQVDTPARTT